MDAYARALSDVRLRDYLRARLAALDMPRADQQDVLAAVLDGLWRRRADADPACTMPRIFGLAKTILDARLVDHARRQGVRDARIVDAPRAAGAAASEPGDGPRDVPNFVDQLPPASPMTPERALRAKEQLAFTQELAPKVGLTEDDVEVMWNMTYDPDASWEELAAERGVGADALRMRISRLREKLNRAWTRRLAPRTLLTLMLLLLVVWYALAALGPARSTPLPEPLPPPPPARVERRVAPPPATTEAPPPVLPRGLK